MENLLKEPLQFDGLDRSLLLAEAIEEIQAVAVLLESLLRPCREGRSTHSASSFLKAATM
jgi:hypothetical protein